MPRKTKIKIPAEPLFRVADVPPDCGLSKTQIYRAEWLYPHVKLRAVKMPGGKNSARLTCRSWVREYIAALAAERQERT